jgi:hypothetical protein
MTSLNSLKKAIKEKAQDTALSPKDQQPQSITLYSTGFEILVRAAGWVTYRDFIIPRLSQQLASVFNSCVHIVALEIGPGPKSVIGYLLSHLRRKARTHTAFEPNPEFVKSVEEWLCSTHDRESPLPCLEKPTNIRRIPFVLQDNTGNDTGTSTRTRKNNEKYYIILFCHSIYGMKFKHRFIEQALRLLVGRPRGGMAAVVHRDSLHSMAS